VRAWRMTGRWRPLRQQRDAVSAPIAAAHLPIYCTFFCYGTIEPHRGASGADNLVSDGVRARTRPCFRSIFHPGTRRDATNCWCALQVRLLSPFRWPARRCRGAADSVDDRVLSAWISRQRRGRLALNHRHWSNAITLSLSTQPTVSLAVLHNIHVCAK